MFALDLYLGSGVGVGATRRFATAMLIGGKQLNSILNKHVTSSLRIQTRRGFRWYDEWSQKMDRPGVVKGYYITYPAVPDQTPQNNPFLYHISQNSDWPPLSSALPEQIYEGAIRLLMDYGASVYEMQELLSEDRDMERTFNSVLFPLVSEEYDALYAFNIALLKLMTDWPGSIELTLADVYVLDGLMRNELYAKFCHRHEINRAIMEIYQKEQEKGTTHQGFSDTDVSNHRLDYWDNKLLENYSMFLKMSGKDRLKIDKKLTEVLPSWDKGVDIWHKKYISQVQSTNYQNQFIIAERKQLKYAPVHILRRLTVTNDPERGPWMCQMTPRHVYPFLRYCSSRTLRSGVWDRWVSKSAFEHKHQNNSSIIEEIRFIVQGRARDLGWNSPAEYSLSFMMAGSPTTVRDFIDLLRSRLTPAFADRYVELKQFAEKNEGIRTDLQPYDLYYISRREAEVYYNVDFLELQNYFQFWPTFEKVIDIASYIMGLKFQDITNSSLERCHPSIRIYAVSDKANGEHLGRFYVDPLRRKEKLTKMWTCILARTANKARNLDKIVCLTGVAEEPDENGISLLHYEQLEKLLFNVGRAVQYLISRSPYHSIAIPDSDYADFDAENFFPDFMKFFIFKPNILKTMSNPHALTGKILDDQNAQDFSLALARSNLWESYRALFFADFDLTLFSMENWRKTFWLDIYRQKYRDYFPFPLEKGNFQPCSFIPLFNKLPLVGIYYRRLWSEMLALDIHETFDRENNVINTGERLKNTMLVYGGGELQGYLYNRFQGRDPTVGAICDFYDPPQNLIESDVQKRMLGAAN